MRRKLCRIFLTSDGSYAVTCPYHPSDTVTVSKRTVNFADPTAMALSEPMEFALLDDDEHRLKLIHHPSGFVQLSGEGIVSGRNADGSPKGLGLLSWPLTQPTAGPGMGVTILNANAFTEAPTPSRDDVVFDAAEIFSHSDHTGYLIELFYFAGHWTRFLQASPAGPVMALKHPSGAILQLRVLMGAAGWDQGFLGITMWSAPIVFGDAESGFAFASPTGNLRYNDDEQLVGEALYVAYPGLDESTNAFPVDLAYRPRDDPPYTEHGPSPSSD